MQLYTTCCSYRVEIWFVVKERPWLDKCKQIYFFLKNDFKRKWMKILICRLLMVVSLRRAVQMGQAKCKITRIIFGKSPLLLLWSIQIKIQIQIQMGWAKCGITRIIRILLIAITYYFITIFYMIYILYVIIVIMFYYWTNGSG